MGIFYGFKVPAGPTQMGILVYSTLHVLSGFNGGPNKADTIVHDGTSTGHSQTQRA